MYIRKPSPSHHRPRQMAQGLATWGRRPRQHLEGADASGGREESHSCEDAASGYYFLAMGRKLPITMTIEEAR